MRVERAEAAGLGAALVAHAALLWALGLRPAPDPVPQPMEVSFVEEVGLQSASPAAQPAAQSVAPELGAPEEAPPAPAEQPLPEPQERPIPQPAPPQPSPTPRQAAPTPAQPAARPQPARQPQPGAGRADANRGSRLGPDLLKGLGADPVARPQPSDRPSAPVVSAEARASMDAAILRALLPCQRQVLPAPEARSIRVRVEVTLQPNGNLASARVLSVANDDPDLRIYEQRMRDLALNVIEQCAPIRGLPAEYYNVPRGWRQFRYVFPNT